MTDKNVCPYCGCDFDVDAEIHTDPYTGNKSTAYQAECPGCGASGPDYESTDKATIEFTHPAHLMKDKVLVKRETEQECLYRLEAVGLKYGGSPDGLAAFADLTTALEVK